MPGRRRGRPERDGRTGAGPAAWAGRLVVVVVLVYAALWAWAGQRVGAAQSAFNEGRFDEAHEMLARAAFWHVRSARIADALGVVDLKRERLDEADAHFAAARRGFFHPAAFGEEPVLRDLLRGGRHEAARRYAAHRLLIGTTPERLYYLGVAENSLNRLDDAEKHLAAASQADAALGERAGEQRTILAAKRKSGRADHLFDRNGAPIGGIDLATGRPATVATEMTGLLDGASAPQLSAGDQSARIRLTYDLEMQRAALAALGEQQGALVVLDVATGAVLAAASRPATAPDRGATAPPALVRRYEPGSIMKMVTLCAALRKGIDLETSFPMECAGTETIDGLAFRDWIRHSRVDSIDHAVAVSCNIAFGRLGREVGREALDAELRLYGFDFESEQTGAGGTDFRYEVGTLGSTDAAHPAYSLARRAEGLDSIQITAMGAALVAAGLARGGDPPRPYVIEQKTNVLGETYDVRPATRQGSGNPLPPEKAAVITRTMKAAALSAGRVEGTARRAAVEGLVAAMKTGTSGTSPPGYDALLIGFAPADNPRIAWGLIAEHAGKAEFEAARITKEFLERIKTHFR